MVDASLVSAPKQRNTDAEKEAIKAGKTAAEIWPNELNRVAQKDTDARWALKDRRQDPVLVGRHAAAADRLAGVRLQILHCHRPALRLHPGEHRHVGIPCGWTDAAAVGDDGQHIVGSLGRQRISLAEEREMAGFKDAGQPHPSSQAGGQVDAAEYRAGNAAKSSIRAHLEHVFAHQKEQVRPVHPHHRHRTCRGETHPSNIAHNFDRLISHEWARTLG
ncbi:MAG: hypothetical protein J0H84_26660 [Rhizobiales bacterium]|nr:hypothetical protein [Hyphomicrobiales bacterium]